MAIEARRFQLDKLYASTDTYDSPAPGQVMEQHDKYGYKRFRFVKFTADVAAGLFCALDVATDNSGLNALPTAAVKDYILGLPVYQAGTISSGYSGWVQTHGRVTAGKVKGTPAAGDPLTGSTTSGQLQAQANVTTTKEFTRAVALEAGTDGNACAILLV